MSIKISELPSAEAVNNGDYLAIVQDGTTKKATASMLSADIATTINSSSTNNTAAGAKAVYDYAAPKKHDSTAQTYGVGTDEKYGHVMLVDDLNSSSLQAGKALSSHQGYVIKGLIDDKQDIINGYNKIDADYVDDTTSENKFITEEQLQEIEELKAENEALLDQIPTATATGETINVQDSSNLPPKDFAMLGNATQADTPTPDTPQDIHVVTGDNTVKVLGKNLFDKTYVTNNVNSFVGTYTWYWAALEIPFIPKTTVTIKVYLKGTHPTDNGMAITTFNNTRPTSSDAVIDANGTTYVRTFDFTNAEHIYLQIRKATSTQTNAQCVANLFNAYDIQLEYGSTATTYEPYTEQTQLLSLGSIELAKIGDYTDRIFKAVQGNSIYDSLDSTTKASLTVGKWYKQGNITKLTFDGSEDEGWELWSGNTFRSNIDRGLAHIATFPQPLLCNYYTSSSTGAISTSADNTVWLSESAGYIRIKNTSLESNTPAINTWLSTHKTILYAPLATPTYTEITDTTLIAQLENVLKMHTNKNVTNAWIEPTGTNAQAGMVLVYRQDLATLISAN